VYIISPLRIGKNAVNIGFGSTAVPDQNNMLKIITFPADNFQTVGDGHSDCSTKEYIKYGKDTEKVSGDIEFFPYIQIKEIECQSKKVGVGYMKKFCPFFLYPFRSI